MNKSELIEKMAKDADISKTAANTALNSLLEGITKSLKKNQKVTLVGFGTFSTSKRTSRFRSIGKRSSQKDSTLLKVS